MKVLFDEVQKRIPTNFALVDVVSELLNISTDSAYRRIRGDKIIDFEETATLCSHFNISLDTILNTSDSNMRTSYVPLDLNDMGQYFRYMQALSVNIEKVRLASNNEILLSALDIPVFHFLPYKDLTFFKLFAWTNSVYNISEGYEDFVKRIETDEILKLYKKIARDYQQIPSAEIWTASTTDTFIRLLNHYYEAGYFVNEKIPLMLCEQLLELIDTVQKWTENGIKDDTTKVPFKLYISEVDLENTFILLKYDNQAHCILKLFTINSLNITDKRFCDETESWLNKSAQRSILISGASEKERYKFFNGQRQKIRLLIDKIHHNRM